MSFVYIGRRMKNVAMVLLTMLVLVLKGTEAAGQIPVPELIQPAKVLSLHRPSNDWKVVTTITLQIKPTTFTGARTFKWSLPAKGDLACDGQAITTTEVTKDTGTSSISCTYQPDVGPPSADSFTFTVMFAGGAFANEVEVPIEIRDRGYRWEFKSTGATVTSDAPDPKALAKIPDIIGGTSQDFLFTVNWQTLRPRKPLMNRSLATRTELGLLRQSELSTGNVLASRSANFFVETGVQSETVAAKVVDLGSVATQAPSGSSNSGTTTTEAVARRNMVLRGEFNVNGSFNADGVDRFLEVGVLSKGSFSSALDSNESFKEAAGRVLQIIPKDRSTYKFDLGVRLAVKQSHELNTTTLVNKSGDIERPSNIENMVLVEFGYRFDSALSTLTTDEPDGDSRRRWVMRAEFSPEIEALPGHQLPTIGIEVSRSLHGGPPAVKVVYGLNLSASKGIFK
jgi:hypothetical protein